MLQVFLLPNYFDLKNAVPPFLAQEDITKGLLNMELYKQIIYPSIMGSTVK